MGSGVRAMMSDDIPFVMIPFCSFDDTYISRKTRRHAPTAAMFLST